MLLYLHSLLQIWRLVCIRLIYTLTSLCHLTENESENASEDVGLRGRLGSLDQESCLHGVERGRSLIHFACPSDGSAGERSGMGGQYRFCWRDGESPVLRDRVFHDEAGRGHREDRSDGAVRRDDGLLPRHACPYPHGHDHQNADVVPRSDGESVSEKNDGEPHDALHAPGECARVQPCALRVPPYANPHPLFDPSNLHSS